MSEFEDDLRIDPNQLDLECLKQPELFYKWAKRAVKARARMDRLKLALDVQDAACLYAVRRDPTKFNLSEKPTVDQVKAVAHNHPDRQKAFQNYLDAKEESALMDKGVNAMEARRRMLQDLVTLHGQNYFASPGTPRDLTELYHRQGGHSLNKRQKEASKKRKKKKKKTRITRKG